MDSEEEDQLYSFIDGKKIFRFEHQVSTLLRKTRIARGARVLDYGCAKSTTTKKLLAQRPDIKAFLYDVSDMYKPFWNRFIPAENYSTHEPSPSWASTFDVVTSFFALEHVAQPRKTIDDIHSLLKDNGMLYLIVPNMYANYADFVVVDHVNHFSTGSIQFLLSARGFTDIDIDDGAHSSAFVVTARKTSATVPSVLSEVAQTRAEVLKISNYWSSLRDRIASHDKDVTSSNVCVYGSGFYGAFITTCVVNGSRIRCYVDQNPYRVGKDLFGKPILTPDDLPLAIDTVYVGLNPRIAKAEIDKISSWKQRELNYFYI